MGSMRRRTWPSSSSLFLLLLHLLFLLPLISAVAVEWSSAASDEKSTGTTTIRHCCGDDSAVRVKAVDIQPNPVVSGKPANFTISATTGDAIDGGSLKIDVSFVGLHVYHEARDLCSETTSPCPIKPGRFSLSHAQTLPAFTPPGKYTLKMTMVAHDGNELTCAEFDFTVALTSPFADI